MTAPAPVSTPPQVLARCRDLVRPELRAAVGRRHTQETVTRAQAEFVIRTEAVR
ncbi:hypothetical protein AB0M32_34680 [Streptomyces sp. NPDC051985]|uniref:hypothetical protein n=1 Tax=Streptomyces sp. NPDC051985 TaxID=3155807 RepID=UPI00341B79AD